jgi:pimeloyl-ACP methyl ester carboxylesterase
MFNDLRSSPEIRDHYQIWFYLYPTGQPFWISAAQLRRDLRAARQLFDPRERSPALDQMVLVGHSMGGLLSRLQTVHSRDHFWSRVAKVPPTELEADSEVRAKLAETFYFLPSPSVRRVITLGTPHHGSRVSNEATQWVTDLLIDLPGDLIESQQELFRKNAGRLPEGTLLAVDDSVESLAPDCPAFEALHESRPAPWVTYHNVVGRRPTSALFRRLTGEGDGVVTLDSARSDDVASELIVEADHMTVHAHPAAVLEVRRILLEHLAELQRRPSAAAAEARAAEAVRDAGGIRPIQR